VRLSPTSGSSPEIIAFVALMREKTPGSVFAQYSAESPVTSMTAIAGFSRPPSNQAAAAGPHSSSISASSCSTRAVPESER
jgi:hypothetical protein